MARDLSVVISQDEFLRVEVEMDPIVSIIGLLNNHIKDQDERIKRLEELIKSLITREEYNKMKGEITARAEQSEEKVAQSAAKVDTLAKNLQNIEDRIGLTITERLNDNLVSTKMQIRAATSSLDQQIQKIESLANSNKKRIDEIERDDSLKTAVDKLKANAESLKTDIDNVREIAETKGVEELKELGSKLEKVEADLGQVSNDVNTLKGSVEELQNRPVYEPPPPEEEPEEAPAPEPVTVVKPVEEEEEEPAESMEEKVNRIDHMLGALQDDLMSHREDVVMAMNAVQDELQLIRDNGRGLGALPPINLVNVVPAFFHEPPPPEPKPKKTEVAKYEPMRPPPRVINLRKRAVTVSRKVRDIPDVQTEEFKPPEPEKVSVEQQTDFPAPVVVQGPPVDEAAILEKLRTELDFDGMKKAFKQFSAEHAEAMSALDRKIDRDYVERLFDKFRFLVHGLNERVKELANVNGDYATREDVALLAQCLKQMPRGKRPATALKKGPGCLFCGKAREGIVGEISPRTAAMAGKPAVGSVLNEGHKSEFVYGDGQAFRRGEEFQSFPNLDTLPRLAENLNQ